MPIDRDKAVGAELGEREITWVADDVILYHLGVGAGVPATDPNELGYTYEKGLKVLPSFAIVAGGRRPTSGGGLNIPGVEFNMTQLLHGEQEVEIHKPLPVKATLTSRSRVADVYDKGKAAVLVLENEARDADGELVFTTRMAAFIRGEGGFGGPSGPAPGNEPPDRAPDGVIETTTFPQQALLYRLSGDKNPLHADPEFAKLAGFDVPIIHGLCSYGLVCKAVVDHLLDGDPTRVARYQARFRGVAYPGETYLTAWWREGDDIVLSVKSKERDAPIISNAAVRVRS
ncbi:MAG: MaoC family dehydratase N-terminal domain-containing protein [Deltaproteobacteria bacterium]|nr:MaoC family dehydratase N-terminal domain-containing protein [Deltaproteobacteria bacterium]MBW2360548.1 MaoC family dehydratase N-terminal domain-containing protein [Deltaproteobacteria bacterium]